MKKVAFIDHSYHNKTSSSAFILELLREKFDVEIIWDDSWRGEKEPDLSFIDHTYYAVVFWQSLSPNMLKGLKCKNIVFFPMYDSSGSAGIDFWYQLRDVKIVCFCKALYNKLRRLGFQAMFIQFFPKPIACEAPKSVQPSIFFWQRRSEITWETIKKLLGDQRLESVHIHKVVDPFQEWVKPEEADEEQYKISYSDWFDSREDYLNIVREKSIYVAPRIFEGIGFSFLEAMAMGKAVIAPDNPTMNEYITHGVNGYLFSVNSPREIQLGNLAEVQKNAYASIVEGHKGWEKKKHKIIDFISAPQKRNFFFDFQVKSFKYIIRTIQRIYGDVWQIVTIENNSILFKEWLDSLLSQDRGISHTLRRQGVKRVAIFGTKKNAIYLLKDLLKEQISVGFFLDNNPDLQNTKLNGIFIRSTEWLADHLQSIDRIIISIEGNHDLQIKKQLLETVGDKVQIITWKELVLARE